MQKADLDLLNSVLTACFIGIWIVLGIFSVFAFQISKNVRFKKKWFPRFIVLGAVLFLLFFSSRMLLSSRSLDFLPWLAVVIPFLALICYVNLRFTKFCDHCGATLHSTNWFSRMRFCTKCGAEFDAKPTSTTP